MIYTLLFERGLSFLVSFQAYCFFITVAAIAQDRPLQAELDDTLLSAARIFDWLGTTVRPNSELVHIPLFPTGTEWGRIELQAIGPNKSSDWAVDVWLGPDGERKILSIAGSTLAQPTWTKPIDAPDVWLSLSGEGNYVQVTRVMRSLTPTERDSKIGSRFSSHPLTHQSAVAVRHALSGVALIHFTKIFQGKAGTYPCSSFLVAKHILVTNFHCVANDEVAKSASVFFDYDEPGQALPVPVLVSKILYADDALDLSVLELSSAPSQPHLRVLSLDSKDPEPGEALRVIHHYKGREKEVSSDKDCVVGQVGVRGRKPERKPDSDFTHGCDTDPRSSGSPVLSETTGLVVGLHHYGVVSGGSFKRNRAIRMSQIVGLLENLFNRYPKAFEYLSVR